MKKLTVHSDLRSIPATSFPIRLNVIDAPLERGTTVKIKPLQWNETFNAYDVELVEIIEVPRRICTLSNHNFRP